MCKHSSRFYEYGSVCKKKAPTSWGLHAGATDRCYEVKLTQENGERRDVFETRWSGSGKAYRRRHLRRKLNVVCETYRYLKEGNWKKRKKKQQTQKP